MKHSVSHCSLWLLVVIWLAPQLHGREYSDQDQCIRDTCRFEPDSSSRTLYGRTDSLIQLELWAWTDEPQIVGILLGFEIRTDLPFYQPWPDTDTFLDSLIVVDTFFFDSSFDENLRRFMRTSLDPDVPGGHLGFNGCLLVLVSFDGALIPPGRSVRLGTLQLMIHDVYPQLCDILFTIKLDSSFVPPCGTFKFSPSGKPGYAPFFSGGKISSFVFCGTAEDGIHHDSPHARDFAIDQNYPNPFNAATEFGLTLPRASHVVASVYNLLGQRVTKLIDNDLPAGSHQIEWDGRSDDGQAMPTGVYFYRVEAGSIAETKKMLLLK